MLAFIGTLLLLYLVWILVKPYLIRWILGRYQRKVSEMFGQAFGQQPDPRAERPRSHGDRGRSAWPGRGFGRVKKKIFSRDDGEYVAFEDIPDASPRQAPQDQGYNPREPQVSDADWEEI